MLIFVDETGDHNLTKIDQTYPIFALGALVISEEEYLKMNEKVRDLKQSFFGSADDFILHASELKRPFHHKSDPRNRVMNDPATRKRFYQAFQGDIITPHKFKLIACFIRKIKHAGTYCYPEDPYLLSFENVLNRIIKHGGDMNLIYAEKRGHELDAQLVAEYERYSKIGIHFVTAEELKAKSVLKLVDKKENLNGLQIIDLMLCSLARHSLGKSQKMDGNDIDPKILHAKLACPITFFPAV